jgi:hypothetical protein
MNYEFLFECWPGRSVVRKDESHSMVWFGQVFPGKKPARLKNKLSPKNDRGK